MDEIKNIINSLKEDEIETFDATNLCEQDVLELIEKSMANMDQSNQKRIVFTNQNETFDDIIKNK